MDVPGFAAGDILFLTKVAEKFCRINFSFYICSPETQETKFSRAGKIDFAEIAQLVERNLAKVEVAGPSPVFRSR